VILRIDTWVFTKRQEEQHDWSRAFDPRIESIQMDPVEVARRVEHECPIRQTLVVISGGEPLLQTNPLLQLVALLTIKGYRVAIETAGTIKPVQEMWWYDIQWNVSPKLENSGNELALRFNPEALIAFRKHGADFKFVVQSVDDLEEVARMKKDIAIPDMHIWIMPEGTNEHILKRARELAPAVAQRGWNLTLRQQSLLYGNERGH
jgi:7-carboxy-7-deazaguanine synthase